MEEFILNEDIKIYCITSRSFPDGIDEVHHRLHKLLSHNLNRNFFGISRPENGIIIYKAGAEIDDQELVRLNQNDLEKFILKKGVYISILIPDFRNNLSSINKAFEKLTSEKNIDPNGYCIEYYFNQNDVRCMIKLT